MSRIVVHLSNTDSVLDGENYNSIKDMLLDQGILLNQPCGGNGTCRKCMVRLTDSEGTRDVLACQTKPTKGSKITVPDSSLLARKISVNHQGEKSDYRGKCGVAVDLGTTTMVVALVSMEDGSILDVRKEWNQQISHGSDVISRVKYIMDQKDGLQRLSSMAHKQVWDMIQDMNPTAAIAKIHIAGNTIMQHIFAGIDPTSIAVAPYTPQTLFTDGKACYFKTFEEIPVYFLPCISGYVGGDIVAGLYDTNLLNQSKTNLFLDIGTNGEMALIGDGQITTVSVASGPAFEGAEISCGMTGIPGAISHITWQDVLCKMSLDVIGNGFAKGLCGSGLIDLIAILVKTGYIDESGHLLSNEEAKKEISRLTHARFKNCLGYKFLQEDEEGQTIFTLQSHPAIYLTNQDVRKLQLAKASVAAGIHFLKNVGQKEYDEIENIYLAGGFGEHINPESAATIGMIPNQLKEKVIGVGNTSLKGAVKSLTDQNALSTMLAIIEHCKYIELSGNAAFSEDFIDQINFEQE